MFFTLRYVCRCLYLKRNQSAAFPATGQVVAGRFKVAGPATPDVNRDQRIADRRCFDPVADYEQTAGVTPFSTRVTIVTLAAAFAPTPIPVAQSDSPATAGGNDECQEG